MAKKCVNINSEEFKTLVNETEIPAIKLAGIISLYQEQNDTDKFPTTVELELMATENIIPTVILTPDIKDSNEIENLIGKFYSLQKDNNSTISNNLINQLENRTDDTINITERKIELLKESLNAEVLIDASISDSGQLLPTNHPLTKKYGKPVIVINPNLLFSDTVIHEFGHLYIDLLKEDDGVLNEAYELLRGTDFYNNISKQYPDLNQTELDKEVLATAIGLEGDKIFKNSLKNLSAWQKIKNYILNKLSKLFNIQPTAIEKLATELLTKNTRLTGEENFNTLITQRSKYVIDNTKSDVQSEVINTLDRIQKDFSKESIDNENIYTNKEGEIFNTSVTKNIDKYRKKYTNKNKGDYTIIFDRTLYNEDNLFLQLNSPKIPLALAKALDDFINDRIINSSFTKHPEDTSWLDSYNREIQNTEVDTNPAADLISNFLATQNIETGFKANVLKHLDLILSRAEETQLGYNQAPIAGNIVHNAIENYINNNTPFPENITDEDNKLVTIIKNIIDKGKANGSVFRTEQILFSETKQIPGTADLLEITKSGEVIIYDYKTVNGFTGKYKGNSYTKTDQSLYFDKGYIHQLLSYGAILNQYGINLTNDPYHIIAVEIKYSNIENENSPVEITDVRNKSLSDANMLSLLNSARNTVFKEFASNEQLNSINIKSDIQDLNDLSNRINDYIRLYKKRTKNLNTNLDTSAINKIQDDLIKQKLETDLNTYIAKNNTVIIKSYIDNVYNALVTLEQQKDVLGEVVSSEYLQALNYLLQSTEALNDIKKVLEDPNQASEINTDDKINLIKTIDKTINIVDNNKAYYKDKVKRGAIASFVENSNLMYGLYTEKYKVEAKKQGITGREAVDNYVLNNLKVNENEIKVKEIDYWTKQYEDGFADLRFLEYLMADPGISKSQFVQLVKNILDKTDNSIRNKMLDVMPDIAKWYDNLEFTKTGDPKQVWDKFIERKTIINPENNKKETKLAGSVIPEFISDYRQTFLKYENSIIERERYLNKLNLISNKTQSQKEEIEKLKEVILALKKERQKVLREGERDSDTFKELKENPEFNKLNDKEKEALRFIHKNLIEADERLYAHPDKKLIKQLEDGSYIFYLPKDRMSNIEAMYSTNKKWDNFKSKFEDLVRPPADEDELNVTQDEYDTNNKFGSTNLDIYGNEIFEIPVYYRNQLEDEALQSYDIPSLLALNHETTITFEENKLVEADLFIIAESLSSKNNNKILKTDSFINKKIQDNTGKIFQKSDQNLVYQAVKSSIDNRLYKRSYKGVYSQGNYRLIKSAEAISKYASTLVLAGNFMSALATFSQGSIYRFIEANVGEHITLKDWSAGTKKAWSDFPNMLKDTQRFIPESKSNLLIRKFGLETQARALTNKFVQDNFAKKNLDSATLFSVTSMAEAIVTSNLMYSLLNNIKVTNAKGEFIDQTGKIVSKNEAMSLDEAYTVEEGKLVLNKNVKYTSFNITEKYNDGLNLDNTIAATEVSRYIRSVYADLYGQYNQDMKSVLQRTIAGKLAMSLRGWLPRGVNRRWRGITDVVGKDFMSFDELRDENNIDKRFYSQDQKQFQEGHYTTTIRFVRSLFKQMKLTHQGLMSARKDVRATMTDHEIANLKRTMYEMGIMLSMLALSMLLRVIAMNSEGDDKDKEKIYFAAYLAERIKTELSTFISPNAMIEMLSNPAASMSVIQRVFDWIWQLVGVAYSKEEGWNFLINDIYEKGTKADENKALIKTMGLIPSYAKIQQMRSILGLESNNNISDSYKFVIKQ